VRTSLTTLLLSAAALLCSARTSRERDDRRVEDRAPTSKYIYGQFLEHIGESSTAVSGRDARRPEVYYPSIRIPRRAAFLESDEAPHYAMDADWRDEYRRRSPYPYAGDHSPEFALDGPNTRTPAGRLAVREGKSYVGRVVLRGSLSEGECSSGLGDAANQRQAILMGSSARVG